MIEREALQSAADEARKVARSAREFGRFLDDYAKYLTQPTRREQAVELHMAALNKLETIKNGLMVCSEWVLESSNTIAVPPSPPSVISAIPEASHVLEPIKPRSVQVKKKASIK